MQHLREGVLVLHCDSRLTKLVTPVWQWKMAFFVGLEGAERAEPPWRYTLGLGC